MAKLRVWALMLLLIGVAIGFFDYYSESAQISALYRPFKLGLDLRGGSQLTYRADISKIQATQVGEAMSALRTVIERRVNSLGLSEAVVQTEQTSVGKKEHRLIIEIPGVMDVNEAVKQINKTPVLEFRTERPDSPEKAAIVKAQDNLLAAIKAAGTTSPELLAKADQLAFEDPNFIRTDLTGQYLKRSSLDLGQGQSLSPAISVEFNAEGAKKFADLTKVNVGKRIGIFLDNELISAPTVREEIKDGKAQISGQFTLDEAKSLVRDLNLGALPVPVELVSTQTVGATLGQEAFDKGVKATMLGFLVIAIFMIVWYRLPGVVAVISLGIYLSIVIALFKLIPITLTAGGIAGLILSIGIAVDANVLIFERMKEEMRRGKTVHNAMLDGFARAWTSIRDSNISTVISALILYWFGTAMIKGFSLNLIIGVAVSMFTATVLSRTFLLSIAPADITLNRFLFSSGFSLGKATTNDK
ncbi:MAG: protein translocase subunit SecD [Candidatus Vogelbacteria bacterium]|nr:protein translocase subunit SecD [Candidatus Vogelbacteria bacterium]